MRAVYVPRHDPMSRILNPIGIPLLLPDHMCKLSHSGISQPTTSSCTTHVGLGAWDRSNLIAWHICIETIQLKPETTVLHGFFFFLVN